MATPLSALHAASRDAYAVAEGRLADIANGLGSDGLRTLNDELYAVTRLLNRELGLRRALGDGSTNPAGRERALRHLLDGKVGASTLDLLAGVVSSRWSTPREMRDGVEALSVTALLIAAEKDGKLDTVEDELFRLGRIVANEPQLDQTLSDDTADLDGRVRLLRGLLHGKVEPVTSTLVEQLLGQLHGHDVVPGLETLAAAAAKRRDRSVAYVRTASPLSEAHQDRLAGALERIYGRPIALHVELDPAVGGGLLIRVGDEVIDGSVSGRLAALRRELAK